MMPGYRRKKNQELRNDRVERSMECLTREIAACRDDNLKLRCQIDIMNNEATARRETLRDQNREIVSMRRQLDRLEELVELLGYEYVAEPEGWIGYPEEGCDE